MSFFVVDVEADGPIPHKYSMVSFGVVRVDEHLDTTFKGLTAPISGLWVPEALAISDITREQHLKYPDPRIAMIDFVAWLEQNNLSGKPVFVSDNPAFDWQWMNFYLHTYLGNNPFGFSARRIGDFYCGLTKNFYAATKWKHLRKTKHTHDPVDDATGNAEALLAMCKQHGVDILKS